MTAYRVDADQVAAPVAAELEVRGDEHYARLRRRLRVRLLLGYLTPLLLLAGWFTFQSSRTIRDEIDAHLLSSAEHQRNTVDLFLQQRLANVRSVLLEPGLALPPAAGWMDEVLARLRRESVAFEDVGLFDEQGTLVGYAGPHTDLLGRSYAGEAWFQRVVAERGGEFISDVYLGFRARPHLIVAVTRDVGGRPWTVRASVDPAAFAASVGDPSVGHGMETLIVNHAGQRQALLAGQGIDEALPVSWTEDEARTLDLVERDVRYVAAIAPLVATPWAVVVREPERTALAPLRREFLLVAVVVLLAAALVAFLALRTTGALVEELRATDATKEDLRGHLFEAAKLASVGEMAAGIAHEINNPLAIIYEEAGIMQDVLDPSFGQQPDLERFRERLATISSTALRGREITRQLLTFARHHDPEPVAVDVNAVVDRAIAARAERLRLSSVEVVVEQDEQLPEVRADANQIEQVLLNLINNARDAMPDGGKLTVVTRLLGDEVLVEVRDSGHGMPPDVMHRVFFPFYTTKEVGKGTGLGLSISYGIVKAHGGRIEVESEVGRGTRFTVALPAAAPRGRVPGHADGEERR